MGLIVKKAANVQLQDKKDNAYFENRLDTSDEWIVKRTGIKSRYFSHEGLNDMAMKACLNLQLTDEEKSRIKLVLVSTIGSDVVMPSVSATIQGRLGLHKELLALDINMACAGFVGATVIAEPYLKPGEMALIVGAEKLSDYTDFTDRTTAIIFADGAGAVLYEKDDLPFVSDTGCIGDDPSLFLSRGGFIKMQGKDVFRFAIDEIPRSIQRVLDQHRSLSGGAVDLYVLHQANARIIRSIGKHFEGYFYSNIAEYANTSSASCPIALSDLFERGTLKDKTVLLSGFGGGLNYASCIIRGDYEVK